MDLGKCGGIYFWKFRKTINQFLTKKEEYVSFVKVKIFNSFLIPSTTSSSLKKESEDFKLIV